MREIRPSGSEGGVRSIPHPYPYHKGGGFLAGGGNGDYEVVLVIVGMSRWSVFKRFMVCENAMAQDW